MLLNTIIQDMDFLLESSDHLKRNTDKCKGSVLYIYCAFEALHCVEDYMQVFYISNVCDKWEKIYLKKWILTRWKMVFHFETYTLCWYGFITQAKCQPFFPLNFFFSIHQKICHLWINPVYSENWHHIKSLLYLWCKTLHT